MWVIIHNVSLTASRSINRCRRLIWSYLLCLAYKVTKYRFELYVKSLDYNLIVSYFVGGFSTFTLHVFTFNYFTHLFHCVYHFITIVVVLLLYGGLICFCSITINMIK